MEFIETPRPKKIAHERNMVTKKTQVRSSVEKAKDDYKTTRQAHKNEIAKLRNQIKMHKLLMKQAKNSYKLVKLTNK